MQGELNNQFGEGSAGFDVPGGYFAHSAKQILNKIEWEEEHAEYTRLRLFRNFTGTAVPGNYFQKKEAKLELLSYSGLNALSKKDHFAIPDKYFEQIQQRLELKMSATVNYPILDRLEKKNPFGIKKDYFVVTEQDLKNKVLKPGSARVVRLFPKNWIYTLAASLLIAIGIWFYNYYYLADGIKDCGSMACIDKDEITKSRNLELLDEEQLYELVNTKELEHTLEKKKLINTNDISDSSLNSLTVDDLLDEI